MKRLVVLMVFTTVLGYAQDFKQTPQFRAFTFTYPQYVQKGFNLTGRAFVSKPVRKGFDVTERVLASKPAYRVAQVTVIGGTFFDGFMTYPGVSHKQILYAHKIENGASTSIWINYTGFFNEGGWAKHFVGPRNPVGAVAMNVGLSAGTLVAAHYLRKHNHKTLATLFLLWKANGNIQGGLSWVGSDSYGRLVRANPELASYDRSTWKWLDK